MNAHITFSSTPWGEKCAQTVDSDYDVRANAECKAFIGQLQRHYEECLGRPLPDGLNLVIKSNPHDFRTYFDVSAVYHEDDKEAAEAALWLDNHTPEYWDDIAKAALNL